MTDDQLDAAAAAMLSPQGQPAEDRAAAARFGFMAAADTNPDLYAEAQRIARRTGVPTMTALNVPAVKKQAVMGEIPFEAIARDAPTTAAMLADVEASRVIHDDIGNLTGIEKALRVLGNTGSAVLSAGPKFNEGAWGLVRAAGELMGAPGRPIVESATRLGQTARGQADSLMPKAGNVWEAGLYSGAQSFGVNLLQLPLALVPGGPAAAGARMSPVLWSMGANTGGQAFAEARDKGVPLPQALAFGASQGVIEAGTEMLGMPALFSLLKPGQFGAKALEYLVKEQGGEQIATALQDLNEWAVLPENAGKTFGDYLAARPNAALQTAIATAVGGGAQVATVKAAGWAVNRAEYQQAKAELAEQRAQMLAQLGQLAQANKVLQRSPETFQEFVAKATEDGPLQAVYIDGQTLMQSGLAEQVAAISPAVAEQVQQAAQTGGAVAIPVDEYAARIAPTDLAQQLQPHLRTEADGFSQAEAQQYMQSQGEQLQADLDRAVADSQQGDAFRASADVVTGQVRQQLDAAARFRPEVNDAYARVVGAYYATRAAQLGVTPEALFERRRLTVGAESAQGGEAPSGAPHLGEAKTGEDRNGNFYTHTEEGVAEFRYTTSGLGVFSRTRHDNGKVTNSVLNKEGDFVDPNEINRTNGETDPSALAWIGDAQSRDVAARIAHFKDRLDLSDAAARDLRQVLQDLVTGKLTAEQAQARANEILAGDRGVLNQAPGELLNQGAESSAVRAAMAQWTQSISKVRLDNQRFSAHLPTSAALRALGVKDKALEFPVSAILKIAAKHPDVPAEVVQRLPELVSDPLFILPHPEGGVSVVLDATTAKGEPIIVGVRDGRVRTITPQNDDAAITGQERLAQKVAAAIARGDKVYARNNEALVKTRASAPEGYRTDPVGPLTRNRAIVITRAALVKLHGENFYQPARGAFNPESQDRSVTLRSLADEGNRKAVVAQALVDRLGGSAEQLADVFVGESGVPQPDGLVGVPTLQAVLTHMRAAVLDDPQILDAVVGSVPVDVVNNLFGSEGAAKVALHDQAVLQDSAAFNAQLPVSGGLGDTADSVRLLVREAARGATETARVSLGAGLETQKGDAAPGAGKGNGFSQGGGAPRAMFDPSTLTVVLLRGADLTSFLHEGGHFFFENDIALASEIVAAQRDGASITPGEQQLLDDVGQLLTWHGLKGDVAAQLTEWHNMPFEEKRALHERTAESFEAYLFEGKAPSIELAPYFQRFRSWLLSVYRSLKDFLAGHPEAGTLTPEVRAVFDRMLATNEAILMAEQGRSMLALFETAAQAGMSPEAWAAYQAQGNQATQDAVQDLQARGLRDLQWLKGARSRMLKKLQGEAKAARDAAAVDVRREVMAEPVYRAWRFLTGRLQDEDRIGEPPAPPKPGAGLNREVDSLLTAIAKLGGISRASAAEHLGVHADDFRRNSGVFGKRLFLKEGGLSADAMAELLLSEGYLRADENGLADLRELEELVAGELGGAPHYSAFRDPSLAFEEARAGDQVQDPSQLGAGRLDVASLREMYGASSPYLARRQASTFGEAKEKAAAFAGEDKPALKNRATGMEAKVSRSNVAKMLSGKAVDKSVSPAVQALAVANVDKLFELARLGETRPDRAGDPHIVAIHRFFAPLVTQEGQVYQVKLTVKELAGEANKVYTVEALEIESATPSMDPAEPGGVGDRVAPTVPPGGGASASIAQWTAQVKAEVGVTTPWQRLTSHGMTATKGALHPDVAAGILGGFDSGDALVQALLAATPLDEEIEARIDQRMLEQHGELATPEALEAAADAAIHSEARGRMVATELAALTKATGAPKVLADAARQFAAAAIARLKVRNLTPSMFSNAQAKAARNAAAALKKGDLALAAAEKRNEILQHYSAKAAHEARDEIERGRKYLAGFDGDVKGLDAGYLDQIAALLERFDLRKGTSLRAADKRKSLAAWLEAQREAGMEPDVPAELQNEAFTKSYKDMTVEEFRGLRDTVKQIEHLGRLKHKLLTAADQRAFDAVRDEIAASIGQHANGAAPEQSTPATDAGARKLKAHQFFLSHLKVANIAQRMDGGETGGPVWTFFARSAQERANWKAAKQAELTGKLMEIMRPVLARAGQFRTARARPALGISLTQEQVFALALNMGNEGNISRLLTGGINGRHFSHGQLVQLIDDELTAADLAAVQAIWDLMAELTPEAQAKHKRLYGREMELVAPTPLVTKHGTLRGGYYPIVYDPRGSVRVGENEADAVAKDALRAAHTAATTRRSYTKARLDETPYPLILTMGGVHRGLSQVVHDLAWHEWSMDVGRMLRDKTFQAAVLETYGLDYLKALQGWHEDIVTENVREQAGWERFGVHLRASVPAAAMGYSLLTAIQQPIGLTQSMARLGSGAVFKALAGFVGSPRAKITKARELSAFMRSRGITRFREVADLKRQIDLTGNRLRQAHSAVAEHAFDLLGWVQTCVDVPTWHAAFEKATAEGKDQATAVAVADQAVIDTQGDGAIQNLSGVQRDRFGKWLTLFYSYLSGALNMIWQTAHSERSLPRKTADILMLTMVPATLTALIKWAVKPGDDDDDEKYWKLVQQIMKENISLPLSMFVGIRELSDQAASLMVGEPVFSYQGPGSFRVVAETAKLLGQVSQGELDAGLGRSVINVAGSVTGLPSTQINRTIQGAQALADGETQNPAAVAFGFQKPR